MSKSYTVDVRPTRPGTISGGPTDFGSWQDLQNVITPDGGATYGYSSIGPGLNGNLGNFVFETDLPSTAIVKSITLFMTAAVELVDSQDFRVGTYRLEHPTLGFSPLYQSDRIVFSSPDFVEGNVSGGMQQIIDYFNNNPGLLRHFGLTLIAMRLQSRPSREQILIDSFFLRITYTVPENQLHPNFVAPNYAVNKRSEVFVPSAKAKYFLFKERAWKVGEAPVMSSDLSIRTTALQDDRFLVVDGEAGNAWVFDPALNAWISTSAPQINDRRRFTLTVLQDGRVLLWGGKEDAEIYDPVEESWETSYAEASARENHTSTLLNDGRVVIAGGLAIGNPTENLLVYNLYTNSIKQVSFPPLLNHCAVLLPNGKVLFYGGWNETQGKANEKVYVFDPDSLTIEELVGAPSLAGATSQVFFKDRIFFPLFKDESRGWYYNFLTDTWTEEPSDPETLFISGALGAAKLEDGSVLLFSADSSLSYVFTPRELRGEKPIRLNGMYIVKSTPTPYVLVVETGVTEAPFSGVDTTNATLSSFQAEGGGSYIYDEDLPAITSIQTTLTKPILAGRPYSTIEVADASLFPDEKGYLVFAFGREEAIYPVGYRNRPKSNLLVLDGTVTFPRTLPIGETVTYAIGKAAKEITNRPFYVTASTAGRIAAQKLIDSITAAGAKINVEVRYPGINGLMDEDKEWIWGE